MEAHYKLEYVRKNSHIGMPTTSSTEGESLAFTVSNVTNQFILRLKLVGITSDEVTYMSVCKAILESNFDNTGVFDLGKSMFVMYFLDHFLSNAYK